MQPQKLCLKWNNHTSNLISVLGSFQQKETLVDVTISCEGQNIKAHRIVLSACSPYFQNMFLDNPCTHPIVIMNGMKYEDLNAILNFMYKGEVNVSHDGLSSFLQAAELLKVKGLAEVCGEKKNSTNSINQEVQQSEQNRPQRTDTPPRKRHRNRKRSLSDSNRSDDEGTSRKQHREPCSPEVHELSGDESFTGDNNSNGPPFNSVPRVPQNVYSRSHQSSSNVGAEEDEEYEVEPSKLLEQTLTTESVSLNNSNSDNNLRIERIMGNATDIESSSLQEPESPPDIKPIIDYGESSAGPSEGTMMLYNEQSQPGPSNMQDGSLLHDNSHAQDTQHAARVESRPGRNLRSHTCETTQLLKELKEDPLCLCQLNNAEFTEVSSDNELNSFLQKGSTKSVNRSKQLLIYNEEGCMKGIEVDKGVYSDSTSNLHDLQFSNDLYIPETYILIEEEEEDCVDTSNDHFNNSSVSRNFRYSYKPESNDASDRATGEFMNLVPESYTQCNTQGKKFKNKRRKRGRPKIGPRKKSKSNTHTSRTTTQSVNKHPIPYTSTVLEKQSYTQVSVEEVHLTKPKNPVGRPRRNTTKKTASEMLMLKRKIRKQIVHSTSIEYQPSKMHQQYNSNLSAGIALNSNFNSRQVRTVAKQPNEMQVVKYRGSRYPPEVEKYGPTLLPPGWNTEVVTRKSGKSAGQIDVYFLTPEGKRLRSRVELASYIEKNRLPYSPEEFCFRKGAYKMLMLENSKA